VSWLVVSIVLSLVLTVLLNVWLRLFPDHGHRAARRLDELARHDDETAGSGGRVRVFVPWKAMITASVVVTIVVNIVLWIT
jgi:hypothetical protein